MYGRIKQVVLDLTGLGPDILHILFGVALFASAYGLIRRKWLAFFAVAAIQFLNEALDIVDDVLVGLPLNLIDVISDCLNTLFVPAIVCLTISLWTWMVEMKSRRSASRSDGVVTPGIAAAKTTAE
ncbi:hypothetical protein [Affinirhizobium pseudoryzae]|uniref:hypothetical protein n=1 Tax=Allorhizobium pseudoryzae TaxID=379684 RepID=UPI0013EAF54C|nr:hypothetical protein [Allorhizobium pseudoryzae]